MPTHWEELSLARCAWLYGRVNELPAEIKAYYLAFASGERSVRPDDMEQVAAFAAEALEKLAGMPEGTLLRSEEILPLSEVILPRFVCGVAGHLDYQSVGVKSFRRRSRRYYYPLSGTDVAGKSTPLSGLCAAELCQVSDIVMSGNLELAPLALALCCRRRGEAYNEVRAQRRSAVWGDLPATVYWELWAQVSSAHEYLRGCFPECYGKGGGTGKGGGAVWSDQLVAMAVGNPMALPGLQTMNGYEFVHLMNESIKNKTEQWKMSAALSGLGGR